jgi:hypothetical protein
MGSEDQFYKGGRVAPAPFRRYTADAHTVVPQISDAARISQGRLSVMAEYMSETSDRVSDIVEAITRHIGTLPDRPDYYEGTEPYSPSPPVLSGRIVDID